MSKFEYRVERNEQSIHTSVLKSGKTIASKSFLGGMWAYVFGIGCKRDQEKRYKQAHAWANEQIEVAMKYEKEVLS